MAYTNILLCVDSSEHPNRAADLTAGLARHSGARVTAAHVYAARLHDRRFADLEPGLPEEFQDPRRLQASRKTHDSLIGKGLHMISDSYSTAVQARMDGIAVVGKSIEGKHFVELVRESADGYDLAVIGTQGLGLASVPDADRSTHELGSVCERFVRHTRTDVLVVRSDRAIGGTIAACVDGSPESYAALRRALKLAELLDGRVLALACFDPAFHPVAFRAIADVLSEKDAKMFRFQEQETLHDEIIDRGLENLYRGYLDNAQFVAKGRGQTIESRLLTGRPAHAIARALRETDASLLVMARHGLHRADDADLGATAEAALRLAPCNVLLVNEVAEAGAITWTDDAEARISDLPPFITPMIRKAVESHARARGLTEITSQVVTDAKQGHGVRMPGHHPDGGDAESVPE